MSLRRLLVSHLGPYRSTLLLVVVLQAVQAFASLTLPALSADLIDKGVLTGDTGYIWRTGAVMLAVHRRADRASRSAPCATARGSPWASAATSGATSSTR